MLNTRKFLSTPVYPFLITIAPTLSLYALNHAGLDPSQLSRPILYSLLITLLLLSISRFIAGTWRGAAILSVISLIGIFGYGFTQFVIGTNLSIKLALNTFFWFWLASISLVYIALTVYIRKKSGRLEDITIVFNVFAVTLLLLVGLPLAKSRDGANVGEPTLKQGSASLHEWIPETGLSPERAHYPDVFFIVLDAYARADILDTRYSYDNTEFLDWLIQQGFVVGDTSHSNYPWTHLSFTSTFNGEYLHTLIPADLDDVAPPGGPIRSLFYKAIMANNFAKVGRIPRFFAALDYKILSNASAYSVGEIRPNVSDDFISAPITKFEQALISQTVINPLLPFFKEWAPGRKLAVSEYDRVVNDLRTLENLVGEAGPKWVFYHIVSPHEPFTFDENGRPVASHPLFDSSPLARDKIGMKGYTEWVRANYPRNVAGLNHHLTRTISSIKEATGGKAVIVIQSDHGPPLGFTPDSAAKTDIPERFGILDAVYLPPQFGDFESMPWTSPVNTFPVLLNRIFGLQIPLQEDRAFFSSGDLEFEEVTDRL